MLEIENGAFTPLVFAANNDGMEKECIWFYKILADMIPDKQKAPISTVTNSIRTLICFSLLRSTIIHLRCLRSPRYSHIKVIDIQVNALIKTD